MFRYATRSRHRGWTERPGPTAGLRLRPPSTASALSSSGALSPATTPRSTWPPRVGPPGD